MQEDDVIQVRNMTKKKQKYIKWKIPKNLGSEDYFLFERSDFQVPKVNFLGSKMWWGADLKSYSRSEYQDCGSFSTRG